MNFPEFFYHSIEFLFTDIWRFTGLLLLISVIRGDIAKAIKSTSDFIKRVAMNYRKRTMTEENFDKFKRDREYRVKS